MELKDAAEHPIMRRTSPTTETYLAQNVSSADVKNPCLRTRVVSGKTTVLLSETGNLALIWYLMQFIFKFWCCSNNKLYNSQPYPSLGSHVTLSCFFRIWKVPQPFFHVDIFEECSSAFL